MKQYQIRQKFDGLIIIFAAACILIGLCAGYYMGLKTAKSNNPNVITQWKIVRVPASDENRGVGDEINKSTSVCIPYAQNVSNCRITVYTPYCDGGKWGYETATTKKSEHLKTCAVDPEFIPLGSTVKVGELELKAIDTGSGVKGKHIDIFFDGTPTEAMKWLSETIGDYADVTYRFI